MKRMKKKLLALSMTAICISAVAAGTLAYYTSEITVDQNKITSGKIEIDVIDMEGNQAVPLELPDEDGQERKLSIMPGRKIPYAGVAVSNVGSSSAWVRVKATTVITSKDGKKLENKKDSKGNYYIKYVLNEDWKAIGEEQDKDIVYYYTKSLEGKNDPSNPNETETVTSHLIEGIEVSPEMGNEYQGCTITIEVQAQAVQSKNNPLKDGMDYNEIPGWPEQMPLYDTAKEE